MANANQTHKSKMGRGEKFALKVVAVVGTIQFFIFCIILAISPVVYPGIQMLTMYLSSSFLQLVLLPLIVIGQNNQSRHAEELAEATYELELLDSKREEQQAKDISELHEHLIKIEKKLDEKFNK